MIGAILIGGQSTRMGTDKSTLTLRDGRTMLDHVATALRAVCDDVVLVGSHRPGLARGGSRDGESAHPTNTGANPRQAGGYLTIADARTNAGPLGGIESLLASNLANEYLVCPCDVPAITPEVLHELLTHREAPATVLRIRGQSRFDPLPARIAVTALPVVTRLLDDAERSVWRLMEDLPAAIVDIDHQRASALRNVNTPDDLNTL